MGNSYTNITVKGASQDQVAACMEALGRTSIISPEVDGAIVVFDELADTLDGSIFTIGLQLSEKLKCVTLAAMNHDDDILMLQLAANGAVLDKYNSNPGYWEGTAAPPSGGDAPAYCRAFSRPNALAAVKDILESLGEEYVVQIERHDALVNELRLPDVAVAAGYRYIEEGDVPEGLDFEACKRILIS